MDIICLHCYYERSQFSSLAVTHAVRHCWTAYDMMMMLMAWLGSPVQ